MQIRLFKFNFGVKWMDGLGKYIPSIKRFWFTSRSFVWKCIIVYGASVCGNIRKNKKSSIHVQLISKERINKESACAPPKAAPIQAQSRRILERKNVIKAIRAKDVTEKR